MPMVIASSPTWETLGYPTPVGSNVNFAYNTWAGKYDGAASAVATSTVTGIGFASPTVGNITYGEHIATGPKCNDNHSAATAFGVSAIANSDWAVLVAVGDLNQDSGARCTAITRVMIATEQKPRFLTDFITLNPGD